MQVNLSDTLINNAIKHYSDNRITLTDTRIRGLSVEVRKNSASFYLRSSFKGKFKRVTLGVFPTLTVQTARSLSIAYKQRLIEDVHGNVLDHKQDIAFWDYYELHFLPWCQHYRRSYKSYVSLYKRHLAPRFEHMLVSEIGVQHITAMVTDMLYKGYSRGFINKTVHTLRSLLKRSEELCDTTYHPSLNKRHTALSTQTRKERYLSEAEARRLRDYIQAHLDDAVVLAIGFLLYTGARRSEALKAEWCHVDATRQTWFVPITKNGKPRHIVLNRRALDIINAAQALQQQEYGMQQRWLFLSPIKLQPYNCIFYHWNRIRSELGLSDMRIHDLRHSFASTLVNNGATLYEVQHLLGHKRAHTTERYAHLANTRLIKAASLIDKAYE